MFSFVISTAIDVNRAVELFNTLTMLAFIFGNEVVIANPDADKISAIIIDILIVSGFIFLLVMMIISFKLI